MSDEAFTPDVFLSPSAKAKAGVRPLAERLRQDGPRVKAGAFHSPFFTHPSLYAFGSDWAQLEVGRCGRGNCWERQLAVRDPLNQERRLIPLRLDDAPSNGSRAQFVYINWLPAANPATSPVVPAARPL